MDVGLSLSCFKLLIQLPAKACGKAAAEGPCILVGDLAQVPVFWLWFNQDPSLLHLELVDGRSL